MNPDGLPGVFYYRDLCKGRGMGELPREFYRLGELAERWGHTVSEILNMAGIIGMTVTRLFKGKVIGSIGNKFDSSPYDEAVTAKKLDSLSWQKQPFYVGYAHLRYDEILAAALRKDQSERFTTKGIVNDEGDIILLLGDDSYSNADLFVLSGEVDRVAAEHPELFNHTTYPVKESQAEQEPKMTTEVLGKGQHPRIAKPSGKPKSYLTEAVEYLFHKSVKERDTDILKAGNIDGFIKKMQARKNSAPDSFENYIGERIKEVKKTHGKWRITTEDQTITDTNNKEITDKGKTYANNDISKILTRLRKENHLPL
ncbi:MAG: hypothetical protein Q8R88_00165 [Desulfoprunum sp.]|nr:hypothetical protein [Desulfoprunum sp.]